MLFFFFLFVTSQSRPKVRSISRLIGCFWSATLDHVLRVCLDGLVNNFIKKLCINPTIHTHMLFPCVMNLSLLNWLFPATTDILNPSALLITFLIIITSLFHTIFINYRIIKHDNFLSALSLIHFINPSKPEIWPLKPGRIGFVRRHETYSWVASEWMSVRKWKFLVGVIDKGNIEKKRKRSTWQVSKAQQEFLRAILPPACLPASQLVE